jgi:hypothetical protein
MSDDLRDALTDIRGVGDAKADEIMTVFDEYERGVPDEVRSDLEAAYDYYQEGQYSYAGKFLRRAVEGLE